MILMRGVDITRAMEGLRWKLSLFWALKSHEWQRVHAIWAQNRRDFQRNPSNGPSNVKAPHKNHKAQRHLKKQVDWYFYANENR